jgi:transcriptional regulator with XRE-family HTH domain
MKRLLSRRRHRGWSWAELAERSGLPVWKLQWWHRRFASMRPARRPIRAFVPVQVVDSPRKDSIPLEVITPSGMRILVPVDFDAEHLRRALKALDPGC